MDRIRRAAMAYPRAPYVHSSLQAGTRAPRKVATGDLLDFLAGLRVPVRAKVTQRRRWSNVRPEEKPNRLVRNPYTPLLGLGAAGELPEFAVVRVGHDTAQIVHLPSGAAVTAPRSIDEAIRQLETMRAVMDTLRVKGNA